MQDGDHDGSATAGPRRETLKDYARRYGQLKREAGRAMGEPITVQSFINWVIETKRKSWCAASWRFNRSALRHGLARERAAAPALAREIDAAMGRLDATRADPPDEEALRTSQQRSKRMPCDDHDRIRHAALARPTPNRLKLVDLLSATIIAGLRPDEWPAAKFGPSTMAGCAWQLVVRNAKHDAVRAHGEFRTLRWAALGDDEVSAITRWIAVAQQAERDGVYPQLLKTLEALMRRLTKRLFPRRSRRPALYSARHEAIARWKMSYVAAATTAEARLEGLAIVAALSGHASDETASTHYGRPQRGERAPGPVPVADPAEVARVRRRMQRTRERLAGLEKKPSGPKP